VANDIAKRLLARVRELREARGLSQEAFAERAGLKYKHYQSIEAGRKNDIRFSTLAKLAKACGLEPWELLNFDSAPAILSEDRADSGSATAPTKAARKPASRKTSQKGA
jgi:transcriptional regulator with XRE-family HTH domain